MKNDNCIGFKRYSKKFKRVQETCSCGGRYNCVDLSKSTSDKLALKCSNTTCPSVTIAHRRIAGPAFDGADRPRATL